MKAIVFGVNGQDGSYLSELLLEKDYEVIGVIRRTSTDNTERLIESKKYENFTIVEGDVTDPSSINVLIKNHQPEQVYNLAAQSHVGTSFEQPSYTFQVNAVGVLNILEAIRLFSPRTRFYQASTSEMFGNNYTELGNQKFQNEYTEFAPDSPYAVSKVAAHRLVQNYRRAYGLHASCGILFNHESPRRGHEFVTRKITRYISDFYHWKKSKQILGFDDENIIADHDSDYVGDEWSLKSSNVVEAVTFPKLRLGNIHAERDWGHALDYVKAMYLMVQEDEPDDYVIATSETNTISNFLDCAFGCINVTDWNDYVYIDEKLYRPSDVEYLLGKSDKARRNLGWAPQVTFKELVKLMVEFDVYNH